MKAKIFEVVLRKLPSGKSPASALEEQLNQFLGRHPDLQLAPIPWSMSLSNAIAAVSSNCVRSMQTIARHFERFANGEETKEQANKEIADHLLSFARQYSADDKTASLP